MNGNGTYYEGFDVHTVEHFSVFVAADVDDDVIAVLVGVDRVQEEEGVGRVTDRRFFARLPRHQSDSRL